jgi:DNA-binding CsgD family transcriptional regulator
MLHGLPAGEQGPLPLLGLDDLLVRAEASHQPPLVLHVLGAMVLRGLALGDERTVARELGRMLLIAEGIDRTWPMASVGPLILVALAAVSRGAVEDAVRVRESMAEIEPVISEITPSLAPAYFAAVTPLREVVPGERYDELAAQVRGLTLRRANRLAQAMVRDYLRPQRATQDPPAPRPSARAAASAPSTLTPRELDVLGQLVACRTNREIADVLGMAPKTVMHHTVAIYRKLGVRGRAEAVARAVRSGTVLPD